MNKQMYEAVKQLFDEIYAPALKAEVVQLKQDVEQVRKLRKDLERTLELMKSLEKIYSSIE